MSTEEYLVNALGNEVHKDTLRVFRSLHESLNPLYTDFTVLGFRKVEPHYDRGRKVKSEYICATSDDLIVEKIFTDVLDENGVLVGLQIQFNWYTEGGEIGATKTEIAKTYNEWKSETVMRERREYQKDFLVREAKRSGAQQYMTMLLHYFDEEIEDYISTGDQAWENAVKTHQPKFINDDPAQGVDQTAIETQIYGILEARPENQLSIKEAILYQLTGVLPE